MGHRRQTTEISRVIHRNVETNLGFDQAIALGRLLVSRGRNAQMTAAQLQGTPTTLSNSNQALVPNEAANKTILAQFRY